MRVRFAPSPTGYLHVGGARTAIFNWLLARRHGGTFVLRIEDTDLERSSEAVIQAILDGMAWLGLSADEGPFLQSAARAQHVADAHRILAAGAAYRCFCTPEETRAAREAAEKAGAPISGCPGNCAGLPPGERPDRPAAVRFKVRPGRTEWDDAVHGPTGFDHAVIEDFVLLRSDGTPTYMLSVVSDDVAMGITHVVRGDDHLSNTPKQILLYRALGVTPPAFAHLPLILGEDKKRLSKRHGATSVLEYRDRGYLPEAMLNFLALLGWSPGDDRQKMSQGELVREFDLSGIGKSGAVFDLKKLDWLNGEYLKELAPAEVLARLRPWLEREGLWREGLPERGIVLLRERARTLEDFVTRGRWLWDPRDDLAYDPDAEKKHLRGDGLGEAVGALVEAFSGLASWDAGSLEAALRAVAEGRGLSAGKLIHPTRLAVTGQGVSPGIFEVLEVLGRERSLARLERLKARLYNPASP